MALITRIRALWTGVAGTPAYLNLYFADDGANAQLCSDAVKAFLDDMSNLQVTGLTATTESTAAVIESTTGAITDIVNVTPDAVGASGSGEVLPRASQALIHWRTGQFAGGREVRGRSNIPYLTETSNGAGGVLVSGIQTDIQESAQALAEGVGSPQLVVWSRKNGLIANVITAAVNSQWAVLTSRRD